MPLEPGLRMTGQFASGKLVLDFTPTSIILDCGAAHVRGAYTVENATDQLLVHVENPGGPFTLAVEPDSSLRGTGSTTINGRLVSGMQGENVTFTPRAETCEVASFRPKTGSSATGSTTKVAAKQSAVIGSDSHRSASRDTRRPCTGGLRLHDANAGSVYCSASCCDVFHRNTSRYARSHHLKLRREYEPDGRSDYLRHARTYG